MKKQWKKIPLYCRLALALTLCACAAAGGAVAAEGGAPAAGAYELAVLEAQKLTPGAAFDPATAETVTSANPGDVVVLTIGLRNRSGAAVAITNFHAQLLYDAATVSPYEGAAPFENKSCQPAKDLTGWMLASNVQNGVAQVSAISMSPYSAPSGADTPLCRFAFRVNDDAPDGEAVFAFDADASNVTDASRKRLDLGAFAPRRLTIGAGLPPAYEILSMEANQSAGKVTLRLANEEAVTAAVSFFDASGQFAGLKTVSAKAQCGRAEIPLPAVLPDSCAAQAALFDSEWRPVCAPMSVTIR